MTLFGLISRGLNREMRHGKTVLIDLRRDFFQAVIGHKKSPRRTIAYKGANAKAVLRTFPSSYLTGPVRPSASASFFSFRWLLTQPLAML